jgi:hypothetical protein
MSWDISIQDLPAGIQSIDEIPDDFRPAPLGARNDLIARILHILPDTDFSDPTWGMLHRPDFSIEFNMGSLDVCEGFMLHIRGGGDVVATITRLLEHLELRGLDCSSGEFFSPQAAEDSFDEWQSYRDRVISADGANDT